LAGAWIVDHSGAPVYGDFADTWVAGWQALNAEAARLYDSDEFVRIQKALLGAQDYVYPNWPYPPTFFLILAPLSTLPYPYAFLTWVVGTLLACLVSFISSCDDRRRSPWCWQRHLPPGIFSPDKTGS
jgi:hypothetical protein